MTKPRPAMTQKLALAFAKERGLFPCVDCDRERDLHLRRYGVLTERLLYTWQQIEKDHSHELADGGKHNVKNLFGRCKVAPYFHHKRKTKKNESLRHHLDRASKKARGEWESKRPMTKTNRPMQSHVNPWGKRT